MKFLSKTSNILPNAKDIERINAIIAKAGTDTVKAEKLALQMASAIKDSDKIARRHAAALNILGADHPVTKAFKDFNKSGLLLKTGKSVLQFIKDIDELNYSRIVKAFKAKGLNFDAVDLTKIYKLSQAEAFKYGGTEGDKYFKIWMKDDEIAFCTWANTMIDDKFNWNQKGKGSEKRIYANIIGNQPHINGYFKSNSYLKNITDVYMIPFTAFGKIAVEMIEDERSKFFNTKNTLDSEPMIFNQTLMLRDAEAYIAKSLESCRKALNELDKDVQVRELGVDKLSINCFDHYEIGEYGPTLINKYWFNFSLPSFTYGKYDWDGHAYSKYKSYDNDELKFNKVGTEKLTASCKKHVLQWIAKAKKLPEMTEFLEDAAFYKELLDAYNSDELVKELKGSISRLLKEIGFRDGRDGSLYFEREFEFFVTVRGRNVWLNPRSFNANRPALAKSVKGLAAQYPQYFELEKRIGTIVPTLKMKPEMLKTIEKIKK